MRVWEKRLEGRLLMTQGLVAVDVTLLETVRSELLRRGMDYEAALTALEMAPGYFRLERWTELRRLLSETLPVLRTRKVEGSALASLTFLHNAPELEAVAWS